jgi:hypothetical protein
MGKRATKRQTEEARPIGVKDLRAIRTRLKEHIAFGWEIYEEHWQSHFVAVFFLQKDNWLHQTGVIYHCVGDYFDIPNECKAKTIQTRLFQ